MGSNFKYYKNLSGEWGKKSRKFTSEWKSIKAKVKEENKDLLFEEYGLVPEDEAWFFEDPERVKQFEESVKQIDDLEENFKKIREYYNKDMF